MLAASKKGNALFVYCPERISSKETAALFAQSDGVRLSEVSLEQLGRYVRRSRSTLNVQELESKISLF